MTLLAEDLLLLLLDDVSGKRTTDTTRLDYALGGALLLELAMAGRLDVTEKQGWLGRERVEVLDATPTGDDLLDDALTRLCTAKGRDPQSAVTSLSKHLRATLLERLAQRGVLRRESDRILGVFPRDRWPLKDATRETQLRGRLHDVLVVGLAPDPNTSALIALLSAIDQAHKVVDAPDRKAVKHRAKAISDDEWAGAAVRKAVQAAQAAVAAGAVAAGVVASSGGS